MNIIFLKRLIVLSFILLHQNLICQWKLTTVNQKHTCSGVCSSIPNKFYSKAPSVRAEKILGKVLASVGLRTKITLKSANPIDLGENIVIVDISNSENIIYYNEKKFNEIKFEGKTNWYFEFVLAHQIGHIVNGDKVTDIKKENEKDADIFAGYILNHLGASVDDLQEIFKNVTINGCMNHQGREKRYPSVAKGYNDATVNKNRKTKNSSQVSKSRLNQEQRKEARKVAEGAYLQQQVQQMQGQ